MSENAAELTESRPSSVISTREPALTSPTAAARSRSVRAVFARFVFAYLLLYTFPAPIDELPGTDWLNDGIDAAWLTVVQWVGRHVFHVSYEITSEPTGSSDTSFSYVQIAVILAVAGMIALVWTWRGARPKREAAMHAALRVVIRYVLALTMIHYGLSKVLKSQFPTPDYGKLIEPFGQASPMGLLWTFMGYSTPYTVLAGAAECVGGALLFFRRTTTLGALILCGVMANVVALNFCYDVPVKLYASHLFFMAVFLAAPDARRLLDVLVLQRPTAPPPPPRPLSNRRIARALLLSNAAFIAVAVGTRAAGAYDRWREYGDAAPAGELDGLYEVDRFERAGVAIPASLDEGDRWRRVAISPRRLVIQQVDDRSTRLNLETDATKRSLALVPRGAAKVTFTMAYARPDADHLVLEGAFEGQPLRAELRRVDGASQLLMTRGFHWISEYPFNR